MRKRKVKLENWSVVDSLTLQEFRDMVPGQRVSGRVRKWFGIPQGTIFSATIVSVDRNRRLIETPNAIYRLGTVSKAYEQWAGEALAAPYAGLYSSQSALGVSVGTAHALR
jgi:hypothetical protein